MSADPPGHLCFAARPPADLPDQRAPGGACDYPQGLSQARAEQLQIHGEDGPTEWCRGSPAKINQLPPREDTKDLQQGISVLKSAAPQNSAREMRGSQTCKCRGTCCTSGSSRLNPNWPRLSARGRRTRPGRLGVSQCLLDDANCAVGTCPRCARHHRHHRGHCRARPLSRPLPT